MSRWLKQAAIATGILTLFGVLRFAVVVPSEWEVPEARRATKSKRARVPRQSQASAAFGYRTRDGRVERIQNGGHVGSGLFDAGSEVLVTRKGFTAQLRHLEAGQQLVLEDGTWADFQADIDLPNGTEQQPILIRPQTARGVVFIGKTRISITGANVIVEGLRFEDGGNAVNDSVLKLGWSGKPCNFCIGLNLVFSRLEATSGSVYYLGVCGRDSTIAHSIFSDTASPGHFIYDSCPTVDGMPARLHLLRNYFADRRYRSNENGYEVVQLGDASVQAQSMYGRVEENLFENCRVPPADTELITVKSSDWLIRNNTFRNDLGAVSLRSANRVIFQGNFFGGALSASGVRVQGAGHRILENHFHANANPAPLPHLVADPAYYYSVIVPAGQVDAVADEEEGAPAAIDVVIASNTFADGNYNIHLGSFYGRGRYTIMPRSVVIENNLLRAADGAPSFVLPMGHEAAFFDNPRGRNTIVQNILVGGERGLPSRVAAMNFVSTPVGRRDQPRAFSEIHR